MANKPSSKKAPARPKKLQFTTGQAAARLNTQNKGAVRALRQASGKAAIQTGARLRELTRRYNSSRRSLNETIKQRCQPSTRVYGGKPQGDKGWICSVLSQITYREKNYDIRECEARIFIEGAEVSAYLRGNVSWSIQTTEGMNTCSFSLNNNQDAFILTPANICSKLNLDGWRVPLSKSGSIITSPSRTSRNVDETAKYIIYKNKYNRVKPGTPGQQIDESGFWLFPLSPFHCIFNKHDCVRVFYRLPHVTGLCKVLPKHSTCVKGKRAEYEEAWAPAFTGFIDEFDFEDDPVTGDRVVNIRCYDWKGLLDRMRVRTVGSRTASGNKKDKEQSTPPFDQINKKAGKEGKNGETRAFLSVTNELGIDKELNSSFRSGVNAEAQKTCGTTKQKTGKYLDCYKGVYNKVKADVSNDIETLRKLWAGAKGANPPITGVKPAFDAFKKDSGSSPKLTREGDEIKWSAGKKGAKGLTEAIGKAIGFLSSTGKNAEALIPPYQKVTQAYWQCKGNAEGYAGTGSTTTQLGFLSCQQDVIEKQLDVLDASVRQNYPTVYNGAGFGSSAVTTAGNKLVTKRDEMLNSYLTTTTTAFFQGVAPDLIKKLDDSIRRTFGGRHLFGLQNKKADNGAISFLLAGTSNKLQTAMAEYLATGDLKESRKLETALDDAVSKFNLKFKEVLAKLRNRINDENSGIAETMDARQRARINNIRAHYIATKDKRKANRTKQKDGIGPLADLVVTDAKFSQQSVGMYGDLVRAVEKNAHPLAGMSYEGAVEWLTLTHTPLLKGFEDKLQIYDRNKLRDWNLTTIFGILGRPLTYREVTELGKGTVSELDFDKAPYSPLNSFVHMLLPKDGTGASTIVQQDITHNPLAAKEYDYKSRLELLRQISDTLDYQFYCTPMGDLAFEFPNYNAMPYDFGRVFQGAYTVVRGLRTFKLASEQGELNTAWVLTPSENEKIADDVTSDFIIQNKFKKVVIVADMLARRIGVKVRHLKISLPGVGAILPGYGKPLSALLAFGMLEIQRELGRMESATVQYDFRPYLLPNRPIHIVHRQRMALVKSVNYSMTPLGECTSSTDLHYVRSLHQDGSFRHMAGGTRLPVDYSGLFTGDTKNYIRFGAKPNANIPGLGVSAAGQRIRSAVTAAGSVAESNALRDSVLQTTGPRKERSTTNWACGPFLKDRWIEASYSYGDQIDASFRQAEKYSDQTSGSRNTAGALPPSPRNQSFIGGRYRQPPTATGQPDASVTLQNTSINNATEGVSPKDAPTQKINNADYWGRLYNPWPYGIYSKKHGNKFNNWGFYRVISPSGRPSKATDAIYTKNKQGRTRFKYYRGHNGKTGGWHQGVDFNFGRYIPNLKAYTPIRLEYVNLFMGVGWNGYKNSAGNTKWVLASAYLEVGGASNQVERDILLFGVRPNVSGRSSKTPVISKPHPTDFTKRYYKVDVRTQALYKKYYQKGVGSRIYANPKTNPKMGLTVRGYGYATMPGSQATKVACKLHYVHCGDLVKGADGKLVGEYKGKKESKVVQANTPVAIVGQTGTNNFHMHLEMYIYPPGAEPSYLKGKGGTDPSAWKEVLKANHEFLRTQMKMKITAGKGLNSSQFSDSWKRYFEQVNRIQGTSITTVDQAVEYMLSKSKNFKQYTSSTTGKEINTNPLFFFRPEQIFPDMEKKYLSYRKAFGDRRFEETRSGSSECGINNAALQQKIALEYAACLHNARGKAASVKRSVRRSCREKRNKAKSAVVMKQRKLDSTNKGQTGGATKKDRVQRKLDNQVAAMTQRTPGDPGSRDDYRSV